MKYIIIKRVDCKWQKYAQCLSAKEAKKVMANLAVKLYEKNNAIVIRNKRPYDVNNRMYVYSNALWDFLNYGQDRYRAIPMHVYIKGFDYYEQCFNFRLT